MGKLLFRIARLKIMGTFIGLVFAYFPFLVPVKKIRQNRKAVSFTHPAASYPNHVLIILRKVARTVFHLTNDDFDAVIEMAAKIRSGDSRDYVLVINGGKRQDVMQAHFHLFTGNLAGVPVSVGATMKRSPTFVPGRLDLRRLLIQHNISEESFSLVFQIEGDTEPVVYLT